MGRLPLFSPLVPLFAHGTLRNSSHRESLPRRCPCLRSVARDFCCSISTLMFGKQRDLPHFRCLFHNPSSSVNCTQLCSSMYLKVFYKVRSDCCSVFSSSPFSASINRHTVTRYSKYLHCFFVNSVTSSTLPYHKQTPYHPPYPANHVD